MIHLLAELVDLVVQNRKILLIYISNYDILFKAHANTHDIGVQFPVLNILVEIDVEGIRGHNNENGGKEKCQ